MLKNQNLDCCGAVPPPPMTATEYTRPSIIDEANDEITRNAAAIARLNKRIEFARTFPEAAAFIVENGMHLYN